MESGELPENLEKLCMICYRQILEKHGIRSKETTLKLGKRCYRPDFLLFTQNTIIEAMGLNADSYWKCDKGKTKDYLRHKYEVIAAVPSEQLCRKARRYRHDILSIGGSTLLGRTLPQLSRKDTGKP